MRIPSSAPVPRVARSRRDDRYRAGRPTEPKRAAAGWVTSVQADDTCTVLSLGEELTGVIYLDDPPPVGAVVEVEARGDLLVIPRWYPGPVPVVWVQDPDFDQASQSPRATLSALEFFASDEVNGTSGASYAALIPLVNSGIASLWASTEGDLGDAFLTDPTGGVNSFPSTTYSRQQWSVTFSSTTGWSYQVLASHQGFGVFTRAPNLSTYTDGPGIEWESDKARMVGATIKVKLTYWLDKSPTGVTLADVGSDVEVYLYRFAANNNQMIAPKARRLIHTGTLPLIESSGGPGAAVVDVDVVLTEADLEGWDYTNGLMFYSILKTPLMPRVTALSTHSSRVAARYNADVEVDPASFWTVRPPRWRVPA